MITDWETLVEALRKEVQEYGELLNLFGQQQDAILGRDPDMVLVVTDLIGMQVKTIDRCRRDREALVKDCAAREQQPLGISLRDLMPFFLKPVHPLLNALIDEVNSLVSRTKRRARQNQLLLARSIEVSQQILQRLNPGGITKTYSNTGCVSLDVSGVGSRCIATS